jgi:hypothetical protein
MVTQHHLTCLAISYSCSWKNETMHGTQAKVMGTAKYLLYYCLHMIWLGMPASSASLFYFLLRWIIHIIWNLKALLLLWIMHMLNLADARVPSNFQKCYTTHMCFRGKNTLIFSLFFDRWSPAPASSPLRSCHAILSELQGVDATLLRPRKWLGSDSQCCFRTAAPEYRSCRTVLHQNGCFGTRQEDLWFAEKKIISCDLCICDLVIV